MRSPSLWTLTLLLGCEQVPERPKEPEQAHDASAPTAVTPPTPPFAAPEIDGSVPTRPTPAADMDAQTATPSTSAPADSAQARTCVTHTFANALPDDGLRAAYCYGVSRGDLAALTCEYASLNQVLCDATVLPYLVLWRDPSALEIIDANSLEDLATMTQSGRGAYTLMRGQMQAGHCTFDDEVLRYCSL